jgi:hypothetical protein
MYAGASASGFFSCPMGQVFRTTRAERVSKIAHRIPATLIEPRFVRLETMIQCPNCGYQQPEAAKCAKCSSLFSYYAASDTAAKPAASSPGASNASVASTPSISAAEGFRAIYASLSKSYRFFRWVSLALVLVVVLLILHKSPPPQVPVDPQAAARAESKIAEAQAAVQQGQPYQLKLDRTELNSYLNSNLALPGNASSQTSPSQASASARVGFAPASAAGSAATLAASPASALSSEPDPTIEQVQSAVKDVKVDLDGDLVKAYVVYNFHGKDLSLELDGHLSAENGYLHFEPVSGELGSLPLPQSTLDAAVDKLMSSPENREKMKLPDGIQNLQIVNGQVVVSYQ